MHFRSIVVSAENILFVARATQNSVLVTKLLNRHRCLVCRERAHDLVHERHLATLVNDVLKDRLVLEDGHDLPGEPGLVIRAWMTIPTVI
jgi:hypothetical protein